MSDFNELNPAGEHSKEQEIDIKRILYICLSKWYWFVISVLFFLTAAFFYLKWERPVYEAKMSVLLKSEQSNQGEQFLLQELGYNSGKNNIDDEIGVFKSPDLMTKVVNSLDIYTEYRMVSRYKFYSGEIYKGTPIYVRWEDIEPEKIPGGVTFLFNKNGKGIKVKAQFYNYGEEVIQTVQIDTLPTYINLKIGRFYIAKNADKEFGSRTLKVIISNPVNVAKEIISNLSITPETKMSSLLNFTLKIENTQKGIDILNALLQEYNKDAIADKNMIAYNTAVFIEERLKNISADLQTVESDVESFLKRNKITNLEMQAGSYVQRGENYEAKRLELDTKLNLIGYIETFVNNPSNRDKVIPNLGITDPTLVSIINKYNDVLIQKERIQSSTSTENPAYIQIRQQVESMRESIRVSLQNEYRAAEIAIKDLDRENTVTNMRSSNLPTVQREYNEILREQSVKSNLFVYLLQKREETNLTQAGVAPKGKQIARAFTSGGPVSPKKNLVYLAFFVFGILVPSGILYLIDFFQTRIEGSRDLSRLSGTSVIGDIAQISAGNFHYGSIVVKDDDDSAFTEMFRTFRNNLLFMIGERNQKVIMVTSTVPKEGKTFVAANLAKSLAFLGKRVLVLGGDLRNPKVHSAFGLDRSPKGFSSLLAGLDDNYRSLIFEIEPNLHLLPAGSVPPNPNELLSKPRTAEIMEFLKRDYDYIVIDTTPMGLVTDSMLMSKYADATVYVMCDGFTEKDSILFLNNLIADKKLHNVGVVLNYAGAGMPNSKYNYAYKYGYRYTYAYRYKYGYGYKYGDDAAGNGSGNGNGSRNGSGSGSTSAKKA